MDRQYIIERYKDTDVDILNILRCQDIARACLSHMEEYLRPGLTERQIHAECEDFMRSLGAEYFWTHDDPALILFGDLTDYSAHLSPVSLIAGTTLAENDLITIDVSPAIQTGWGDMARSFVMEDGRLIPWETCRNDEIREGMEMEMRLHELFKETVKKDVTFHELHEIVQDYLNRHSYVNLDYHGNFGHSIENHPDDRVTTAEGVNVKILGYGKPMTFEPHIRKRDGRLGVKHENIYCFANGSMEEI